MTDRTSNATFASQADEWAWEAGEIPVERECPECGEVYNIDRDGEGCPDCNLEGELT